MKLTIKSSWDALTWNEYEQIYQILESDIPSDYKAVHLISVLSNTPVEEIEKLPVSAFQRILPHLNFLTTDAETHYHKMEYVVNGHEYDFKGVLTDITTAQYIDYRTYIQEDEKDVVKLMSCFLIPKGHEYNDGYDMNQVRKDIGDMCWLDVRAAAFFFRIQLATYTTILKSYLKRLMKKSKAKRSEIKQMEDNLDSMVYSLVYSGCVTNLIPHLIQ